MKFLVDQNLPPGLVKFIIAKGHEALHVREVGLKDADDDDLWKYAASEGAVIVTKDDDFNARSSVKGRQIPVVHVRLGNAPNSILFPWFEGHWDFVERALAAGETYVELV